MRIWQVVTFDGHWFIKNDWASSRANLFLGDGGGEGFRKSETQPVCSATDTR